MAKMGHMLVRLNDVQADSSYIIVEIKVAFDTVAFTRK